MHHTSDSSSIKLMLLYEFLKILLKHFLYFFDSVMVLVSRGDMDVAMLSEGIERTPSLFYFQIAILLIRH